MLLSVFGVDIFSPFDWNNNNKSAVKFLFWWMNDSHHYRCRHHRRRHRCYHKNKTHQTSQKQRAVRMKIDLICFAFFFFSEWFRYTARSFANKMRPLFTATVGRWFACNHQALLRLPGAVQSAACQMGSNRWISPSIRGISSRFTIQHHQQWTIT